MGVFNHNETTNEWKIARIKKKAQIFAVINDGDDLSVRSAYFSGRYDRENNPIVWVKRSIGQEIERFEKISITHMSTYGVFCWSFSDVRASLICRALSMMTANKKEKMDEA